MALADTARLIAALELQDKFTGPAKRAEGSVASLDKKMGTLGQSGQRLGAGLGRAFSTIAKIGIGVGAVGIGLLTVNIKKGVDALNELESVVTATETVIKSTGGVAGQSAADIRKLSEQFENLNATMDDTAVQGGANMLLTFKNIGPKAFEPALEAVLDLNQAMGKGPEGLQSTAIQVGKALNDPIKGITALTRVGVTFTQEQKDKIKALIAENDLYGAQQIILKELGSEFGGQFAAAGRTAEGRMAKLGDTIQDLQKRLAGPLLPAIDRVREKLIDILDTDRAGQAAEKIGEAIAGIFSQPNIDKGASLIGDLLDKFNNADFKEGFTTATSGLGTIAKEVGALPWQSIGDAAKLLGTGSKALLDAFLGLPPWVQTAVLTGWGLNKLTGGAVGTVLGEIFKQVIGIRANTVIVNGGLGGGKGGPGIPPLIPGLGGGLGALLGSVVAPIVAILGGAELGANLAGGQGPIEAFLTPDKTNQVGLKPTGSVKDIVGKLRDADRGIARVDAAIAESKQNDTVQGHAVTASLQAQRDELVRARQAIIDGDRTNYSGLQNVAGLVRDEKQILNGVRSNSEAQTSRLSAVRDNIRASNATLAQIRDKRGSVNVDVTVNQTTHVSVSAAQIVAEATAYTRTTSGGAQVI